MIDWTSERESMAEHFAERAQSGSSYLLSSRASRKLHEEGDEAAQEIARFREEIEKRYLLSVANKFYSFPFTELTFDNPVEDVEMADLIDKGLYCLYEQSQVGAEVAGVREQGKQKEQKSQARVVLEQLRQQRTKIKEILDLIGNRRNGRAEERNSRSKERKLGVKYGMIREEDEELLRKRLYTEPYQKQAGFIVKKKDK